MNAPAHPLDDHFRQRWRSFTATWGGLRLFSEQLPALADQLDEQIIEEMKKRAWNINLAIAVLRGNNEEAQRLLKDTSQKGKLKEISPYWPLFDPLRNEAWFKNWFRGSHAQLPRRRQKRKN